MAEEGTVTGVPPVVVVEAVDIDVPTVAVPVHVEHYYRIVRQAA